MADVSKNTLPYEKWLTFLVFTWILSLGHASFEDDCLKAHNKLRKKHSSPPLELDATIQGVAQAYAKKLIDTNSFSHSNGAYGENLYESSGLKPSAETAVQSWYDEIKDYNFDKPGFSGKTGHFTQVVWKNSKKLGCAYAEGPGNRVIVVANYDPQGNMLGDFPQNVLRGGSLRILAVAWHIPVFLTAHFIISRF